MKKLVAVLGGGVAGMSAAHELINRGYKVKVFERNKQYCGGKARSVNVPNTNLKDPEKYLPGEHGFRFFPGFYKHITSTMKEIPYLDNNGNPQSNGCFDNLVPTTRIMLARYGKQSIVTVASFPKSIKDIKLLIHDMYGSNTGLTKEGIEFFASKMWQLMTSSQARRNEEYENIGWWYYLEADRFNDAYRTLLVEGLTRTLVAAQAKSASTKTGDDILLQLIFNMAEPGINTDRVLNGPTNDRWLNPWLEYLTDRGVEYYHGNKVSEIITKDGKIQSANIINNSGETQVVEADYFVLATPVEVSTTLITEEMSNIDPALSNLETLAKSVNWMNGIQYYLNTDVEITNGHCIYSDSEWAVTSISQMQFWKGYDLEDRYNGRVKGILSVDVSDWTSTEYKGKIAENCEPEVVADLVWEQMEKSLNIDGKKVIDKSMIEFVYVDRDIQWNAKTHQDVDLEPLLVNKVGTWKLRPNATSRIPNFFLASDYVRTNTDLATMEGANEAARRAVNGILEQDNSSAEPCEIWPLSEPWLFKPLKYWDQKRFEKGESYSHSIPLWLKAFMLVWGAIFSIVYFARIIKFELTTFVEKLIPDLKSTRSKFALTTMGVAIALLYYFSTYPGGYITASIWGYGLFSVYVIYWLITKDKVFEKLIVFAITAGIVELFADAYLVSITDTLVYPKPEPMIWDSPAYMPFSWAVVLIQIGYISSLFKDKLGWWKDGLLMVAFSAMLIPLYENFAIHAGWWSYQNAVMWADVPAYIYIAEGLLMFLVPYFLIQCLKKPLKYSIFYGVVEGIVMLLSCILAIFIVNTL
ncbi:MAG: DUF6989 domain-containing protein [Chlorobiota bacterium]